MTNKYRLLPHTKNSARHQQTPLQAGDSPLCKFMHQALRKLTFMVRPAALCLGVNANIPVRHDELKPEANAKARMYCGTTATGDSTLDWSTCHHS